MSALPPGLARAHRQALASARRMRKQMFGLFLASFRVDGLDPAETNDLHNLSVEIVERLEKLPRRASLAIGARR